MDFIEEEYNHFTGETKKWYWDDDNGLVCHKTGNFQALLDFCKAERATTSGFSSRTKFHKVAMLPPIAIEQIMQNHHLDVFTSDPVERKKIEQIIESEYPDFKTNDAKLWRPT